MSLQATFASVIQETQWYFEDLKRVLFVCEQNKTVIAGDFSTSWGVVLVVFYNKPACKLKFFRQAQAAYLNLSV